MISVNKSRKDIIEWIRSFILALIAFFMFTTLIGVNKVSGESMMPNLHDRQRVVINKLFYTEPERGDIVIFNSSIRNNRSFLGGYKRLVKRIVGLPGEHIQIKEGKVYINGIELIESYLSDNFYTSGDISYDIPEDYYWVMGDNRPNSADSRVFGPVDKNKIIGQVILKSL